MIDEVCVFIVDDDDAVRDGLKLVIETAELNCRDFESAEHFLEAYNPGMRGCLLLDMNMPGLNGFDLQMELIKQHIHLPVIFLTGFGDIPTTVQAMKNGAVDFLTKPVSSRVLVEKVHAVLHQEAETYQQLVNKESLANRLKTLTDRELEIIPLIAEGIPNKIIARDLRISYRTVEVHRARILKKTGATSLLELVRLCEACGLPFKPISGR